MPQWLHTTADYPENNYMGGQIGQDFDPQSVLISLLLDQFDKIEHCNWPGTVKCLLCPEFHGFFWQHNNCQIVLILLYCFQTQLKVSINSDPIRGSLHRLLLDYFLLNYRYHINLRIHYTKSAHNLNHRSIGKFGKRRLLFNEFDKSLEFPRKDGIQI